MNKYQRKEAVGVRLLMERGVISYSSFITARRNYRTLVRISNELKKIIP